MTDIEDNMTEEVTRSWHGIRMLQPLNTKGICRNVDKSSNHANPNTCKAIEFLMHNVNMWNLR